MLFNTESLLKACCIWLITFQTLCLGRGQTFELLHVFSGADGESPRAPLVEAKDGSLYGSTFYNGSGANRGTLFRIAANGSFTLLAVLDNTNGWIESPLLALGDGNFYGTSSQGGANGDGGIIRLSADGSVTLLASFYYPTGWIPSSGLIQAKDGNLYGVTEYGGEYGAPGPFGDSYGTIFRTDSEGHLVRILSFDNTNGANPWSRPIQASDGNLYGTTVHGGLYGLGTIYRVTLDGRLTTLVSFSGTNGAGSIAALTEARDGYLYGTTAAGGSHGVGTIFRMGTNAEFLTLLNFNGTNGAGPEASVIQAGDGNFYGVTEGGTNSDGTLFLMKPDGTLMTLLFLTNSLTGTGPQGLVEGRDGNLYGTMKDGPGYTGYGAVFRILMPTVLSSSVMANQIVLSWPTNRFGFVLQSKTDLNSTNWVDVTNPPLVSGRQFWVTNSISAGARFFRLKK